MATESDRRPRVKGTTIERLNRCVNDLDTQLNGRGVDAKVNAVLDELGDRVDRDEEDTEEADTGEEEPVDKPASPHGLPPIKSGDGFIRAHTSEDGVVQLPEGVFEESERGRR